MDPSHEDGHRSPQVGTTHERILRVAKTLFANRGYEHTSTSSIARQAGSSESQLMKHFGSKAGLLEAIFIQGWKTITAQARASIQPEQSPLQQIESVSAVTLLYLDRDVELKLLYLLEGRRIRREGQIVALTDGYLGFIQLIDTILKDCEIKGLLRAGLTAHAVRSAIIGMLEGMLRDRYLAERLGFPANFSPEQLRLALSLALDSFFVPKSAQAFG